MDDDTDPEEKITVPTKRERLFSVTKQLLNCSGALAGPLAPALIARRKETKQFYYYRALDRRYIYYGPTVFQCVGVVLSALSLRLLGRRNSLVLTNVVHLVPLMMFLSDVDLKYDFLATMMFHFAYRFQAPIVTLYIAEVTQPTLRAVFVGIVYLVWVTGNYINQLHPSKTKVLSSMALTVSVACVLASVRATESPYELALKGEREKAERAYERLRGAGAAASDEGLALFEQVDADIEQRARGLASNLFSLRFGVPLLVTTFLYFSDVDLVILHLDTYFKYAREVHFYDESYDRPFLFGLDLYYTLKYTMPICGAFIFCLVCVFIGRRVLFIGSIGLNLLLYASYLGPSVPMFIVPISAFFTFAGAKQIPILLATEIYSGVVRDLGAATSEFVEVIFYTIDHLIIYEGKYAHGYRAFLNFRWTLIPIGLICTYFYMPETKNASLVETDKLGSEIKLP